MAPSRSPASESSWPPSWSWNQSIMTSITAKDVCNNSTLKSLGSLKNNKKKTLKNLKKKWNVPAQSLCLHRLPWDALPMTCCSEWRSKEKRRVRPQQSLAGSTGEVLRKKALGKLHLPNLHGDYRPSLLSELWEGPINLSICTSFCHNIFLSCQQKNVSIIRQVPVLLSSPSGCIITLLPLTTCMIVSLTVYYFVSTFQYTLFLNCHFCPTHPNSHSSVYHNNH